MLTLLQPRPFIPVTLLEMSDVQPLRDFLVNALQEGFENIFNDRTYAAHLEVHAAFDALVDGSASAVGVGEVPSQTLRANTFSHGSDLAQ